MNKRFKTLSTIFLIAAATFLPSVIVLSTSGRTTTSKSGGTANTTLEGKGTYTEPYIIDDADDLVFFSSDVNGGNDYKWKYVKQTADIDLTGIEFTPIGVCGGENYFDGVYLGGGHSIYGLTIEGDYGDGYGNAMFGVLNGEVYSLALIGGKISGSSAAGIAVRSEEESDAIIADCFVSVTLSGKRTAGIADDFAGGYLLGCVSLSETEDGNPAAACSYSATKIRYTYSSGAVFSGTFCSDVCDSKSFAKSAITGGGFYETLNANNRLLYLDNAISSAIAYYGDDLTFIKDDSPTNEYFVGGTGSKSNPYKITTENDLTDLARYVNNGEEFRKTYFKQTDDIDMTGAYYMPIGIYGEGNYFYGVYDGGGHTVSGLSVTTDKGLANNGFFGTLGGTVINLGLVDGFISGNCCGSFASHAAIDSAIIANCYSTLSVNASRSGGIADNFIGSVIGCWYYNEDLTLPIVSYNARAVKYCHVNSLYILPSNFSGIALSNFCVEMKIFYQDDFKNTVTGNLSYVSYELGMDIGNFTKCYSTDYANAFEQLFSYPKETFYAFRLYGETILIAIGCAAIIAITFAVQRRKRLDKAE